MVELLVDAQVNLFDTDEVAVAPGLWPNVKLGHDVLDSHGTGKEHASTAGDDRAIRSIDQGSLTLRRELEAGAGLC